MAAERTVQPRLLDIRNATVYRDSDVVLDNFSLQVEQGQSCAILGRNGSGKSTLLKLLTRELYAVEQNGVRVRILGHERPVLAELRQQLTLVSNDLQQQFEPQVSGLGVVVSGFFGSNGLYHYQQISERQLRRGRELLLELGVADLEQRLYRQMSTGQQRRCLLARALACDPQHLILDEPTSGLDLHATADYLRTVSGLAQAGKTLLIATHHIHEIPPEVERVVFIDDGRVVADGSKQQLLQSEPLSKLFGLPLQVTRSRGYYYAQVD